MYTDCVYCEYTLSDLLLNEIGVATICQELATSIEEKTRSLYANPKWFAEHCVRLHASCYKRSCKAQDKAKLAAELTQFHRIDAASLPSCGVTLNIGVTLNNLVKRFQIPISLHACDFCDLLDMFQEHKTALSNMV